MVENIQVKTVKTDGFSMNYFSFGRGKEPLVILPGLSIQSVMNYASGVARPYRMFTDDFTVYVFDRRKELPEIYSVYDMADDTAKAINALNLGKICLFGASQGGMIAMSLAIKYPELIKKLVICSSSVSMNGARFDTVEKWIELAKKGNIPDLYLSSGEDVYPENVFEQLKTVLLSAAKTVTDEELRRFIILAEGIKDFDVSKDVCRISCPVFAACSDDDGVLGNDTALLFAKCFEKNPDFTLHTYHGYGHAAYDTAPDFKERMKSFLKS